MNRQKEIEEIIGFSDIPGEMGIADLCELLAISPRHADSLAKQEILVKVRRGRFDTRRSIVGFIAYARRRTSGDLEAEKIRLTRSQAEKVELQNEVTRGEMIPAVEVEREWASVLRDVRAAMLAIPSRVQQRVPHLGAHDVSEIDREIRDALAEIAHADD